MITILSHIVEFRNGESGMHVMNIGTLTEILLNQISKKDDKYYLPYAERDLIVKAQHSTISARSPSPKRS